MTKNPYMSRKCCHSQEGSRHESTCTLMPVRDNHHTISNLERATETYKKRNPVYGSSYKRFGHIMHSLFPNGIRIDSPELWNRFGVLVQIVSKLSRYVTTPRLGHIDSVHDMGVYSFMLEELDAELAGMDVRCPDHLEACEHVYDNENECVHCGQRRMIVTSSSGGVGASGSGGYAGPPMPFGKGCV